MILEFFNRKKKKEKIIVEATTSSVIHIATPKSTNSNPYAKSLADRKACLFPGMKVFASVFTITFKMFGFPQKMMKHTKNQIKVHTVERQSSHHNQTQI